MKLIQLFIESFGVRPDLTSTIENLIAHLQHPAIVNF